MSALSLYTIEESLALLAETREAAEAEGDAAAVAECDKALAQYLTAEASKTNSYAALIRRQLAEAEECEAEVARLTARAKARRAFVDRLKATALEVMQRFGVKELRSATNTLRVQKNGGVQPLEISGIASEMPTDCQEYTIRMSGQCFRFVRDLCADAPQVMAVLESAVCGANVAMIRRTLAQRVPCPEPGCGGSGEILPAGPSDAPVTKCPRCDGQGTVPQTIPGAKLLERGSHVRVE
jgi:hypothetical protein